MVAVTCRAAVLMQKWEPHVHSLEKEIRAQMRGVKISLIVFSSGGVSSTQSSPLDPKRMAKLLDNGEENKAYDSTTMFTTRSLFHKLSVL